jgi:hypothetical protein
MTRRRIISIFLIVLSLFVAPRVASAQGFINVFAATTVTSPSHTGSSTKPGFGIALGSAGKLIGGETEIVYFPELLDNSASALSQSKVVTFSANTLIGPKIGPVKVYGAIGAGDLHLNVTSATSLAVPDPKTISNNYFTFNAGGGVMVFLGHFGLRGDARYYKAYGLKAGDLEAGTLTLDNFNFWRLAGGVLLKF